MRLFSGVISIKINIAIGSLNPSLLNTRVFNGCNFNLKKKLNLGQNYEKIPNSLYNWYIVNKIQLNYAIEILINQVHC